MHPLSRLAMLRRPTSRWRRTRGTASCPSSRLRRPLLESVPLCRGLVELGDVFAHVSYVLVSQERMHREAEAFLRETLAPRICTLGIAEQLDVDGLKVNRNRGLVGCLHPLTFEVRHERSSGAG